MFLPVCIVTHYCLFVKHTTPTQNPQQLVEIGESEAAEAHRCRVRLQHLQQLGTPAKEHVLSWNRSRMDRLLADYMLRAGYLRSAASLSNAANIAVC